MPDMTVTFLGTGTSHGVPMIACDCSVCTSADPHDRRTRTSAVIRAGDRHLLIDTAPELRLQCVACDICWIDAVLFTHAHADHVTGFDDLRRFNWLRKGPVPVYGQPPVLASLQRMFAYVFQDDPDYPSQKPTVELHAIGADAFEVDGVEILPIPLLHGTTPVLGFRVGNVAYCTDCSVIPDGSWPRLANLDVLVLDALRRRPHPTHFNLEQAIAVADKIAARQTYFTHIAHELSHADTNATLPDGMQLAHDGLVVTSPA